MGGEVRFFASFQFPVSRGISLVCNYRPEREAVEGQLEVSRGISLVCNYHPEREAVEGGSFQFARHFGGFKH